MGGRRCGTSLGLCRIHLALLPLCISVLACAVDVDGGSAASLPDMIVPLEDQLQDDVIEYKGSSYQVEDCTLVPIAGGSCPASAGLAPVAAEEGLVLHVTWVYVTHVIVALLATWLALRAPGMLLVLLVSAVSVWPLSVVAGGTVWALVPFQLDWWMMVLKSVFVNILPTVPVLGCIIWRWQKQARVRAGYCVYFVLWLNVMWTLGFLQLKNDVVSIVNGLTALSLCISLPVRLYALHSYDVSPFRVKNGNIVLGFGTSLSWLVCYTVWNAMFVADRAPGHTLQDILFWVVMLLFYYHAGSGGRIEDYFGMARPIQLGAYIAGSDWMGLIPFFRDAPAVPSLEVNAHPYFLFIVFMNFLYSFYVLYWELHNLWNPEAGDLVRLRSEEREAKREEAKFEMRKA